ncbi:MAG: hypothetical protein C4320_02645 [Armatimonadota bacterium]
MNSARPPRLTTPWTNEVHSVRPHDYYPRPLLVRPEWTNLNGPWEFFAAEVGEEPAFAETILVPFAPESYLSGIHRAIRLGEVLHYRRTFRTPATGDQRTILHFEAVDWACEVWVDGVSVGTHQGGYDPFSFDVTDSLHQAEQHTLILRVEDPTDTGFQPRGKQVYEPGGINYTATSGIWGTVWLEVVAPGAIRDLHTVTKLSGEVEITIERWPGGEPNPPIKAEIALDGEAVVRGGTRLQMPNPDLWSPDNPVLYDLTIQCGSDRVTSYCAFREVGLQKDKWGNVRLALNREALFQIGPLDQGYWPDGGLTAPTLDALLFDVAETKRLGFNLIRKHVKVEPRAWYAFCDRIGMLVWQDMPSGDRSIAPDQPDAVRSPTSEAAFRQEYAAMVHHLGEHPCIVAWVLFNEGWGQFKTEEMSDWARALDPSRTLVAVTGWADRGTGDVHDWHVYPGPGSPAPDGKRASTLGEFGGLGLAVPEHMWQAENWGYVSYGNRETLATAFSALFDNLWLLTGERGLSAAVYTQTTDVETETNGLFTYDRRELKLEVALVQSLVARLHTPAPALVKVDPVEESRQLREDGSEHLRRIYDVPAGARVAIELTHDAYTTAFLNGMPFDKLARLHQRRYPAGPRLTNLAPGRHILDAFFETPGGEFILLEVRAKSP